MGLEKMKIGESNKKKESVCFSIFLFSVLLLPSFFSVHKKSWDVEDIVSCLLAFRPAGLLLPDRLLVFLPALIRN